MPGGAGRAIIDFVRWWFALPLVLLCGLMLYILLWLFRPRPGLYAGRFAVMALPLLG